MSGEQRPTDTAVATEPRTERGVLVALLSLVFPGSGQLVAGARRRGTVMVAVTVVLLLAAWQGLRGPGAVLELLVRPGGLAGLLVGNAALVVFRVYATLDAFRIGAGGLGRGASEQRATLASVIAVTILVAVTLAPHGMAAHYALVTTDTLRGVFAGPQAEGTEPADATAWPAGWGSAGPLSAMVGQASASSRDGSAEQLEHDARWLHQDRFSVAVLGSDGHPSRPGDRIDAMMVVSMDLESGHVAVFSIERHLRDFPLPTALQGAWERRCRDAAPGWELLNAMYRCAHEAIPDVAARVYPRSPDPAAAAVSDTLGALLDLPIDDYVMVDMAGFVEVVDALGGVRVDTATPSRHNRSRPVDGCDWRAFDVQPETRQLDGAAALELMRDRTGTTSADRMGRQRCMLVSLARQVDAPILLRRFGELSAAARQHVTTSIPLDELPAVVELVSRIDRDRIETVGFGVPGYMAADSSPQVELIRAEVQRILEGREAPLAGADAVR